VFDKLILSDSIRLIKNKSVLKHKEVKKREYEKNIWSFDNVNIVK
jgi:hypothetical protein